MSTTLQTPFHSLPMWVEHLSRVEIPVLPETIAALDALREEEDRVDAQQLADIVMADPLMCVKLYRQMASLRRGSQLTDVERITGCIVMMGVPPFFRYFSELKPVSAAPGMTRAIWPGFEAVLIRSRRASELAFEWAVRRNDLDAEIIATAALLHDFAEMLLWCVAPVLMARVSDDLAAQPGLRSADGQRATLNIEINALQHALMQRWRLPELLVRITDDAAASVPKVRNVMLAVAMARHSAQGWDNPALPDDYSALGELLNLPPTQAKLLVAESAPGI